jgi:hypothetical protein
MLEVLVDIFTRYVKGRIFTAFTDLSVSLKVKLLESEAHQTAVVSVHLNQVLREERRLRSSGGRLNFHFAISRVSINLGNDFVDNFLSAAFECLNQVVLFGLGERCQVRVRFFL